MLQGDVSLSPRKLSFNQLQALVSRDHVHGLFELVSINESHREQVSVTSDTLSFPSELLITIIKLLKQYEHLFHTPTSLHPHRAIDHKIHLIPHTKPVNVRPYRYPHFQKAEMERLIKEMLD